MSRIPVSTWVLQISSTQSGRSHVSMPKRTCLEGKFMVLWGHFIIFLSSLTKTQHFMYYVLLLKFHPAYCRTSHDWDLFDSPFHPIGWQCFLPRTVIIPSPSRINSMKCRFIQFVVPVKCLLIFIHEIGRTYEERQFRDCQCCI